MKTKEEKSVFKFWLYFKPYGFLVFLYIFFYAIEGGISIFNTIYVANTLAIITEGLYTEAIRRMIIILVVFIVDWIINHITESIYLSLATSVTKSMSIDIINQAFMISSRAYSDHKTANFTDRILSDPSKIFKSLDLMCVQITYILSNLIILFYITFLSPWIGLICILAVVIGAVIEQVRRNKRVKLQKDTASKYEVVSSAVTEVVKSEKDIKSLGLEDELKSNITNEYNVYRKSYIKQGRYSHALAGIRSCITYSLILISMILGVVLLDKGAFTFATFMIIYSNKDNIFGLTRNLGSILGYYTDLKVSVERINELFEDDEYELEHFGNRHLDNVVGKIEFKNVGFSYKNYKDRDIKTILAEKKYNKKHRIKTRVPTREMIGTNKVFDRLSFVVEPNSTVAFVGKSGSGKSTILSLMSKMYDANKGKVLIDNIDIKTLDKETLRSSISLVNQFPYIFDMSIKENLLLAKPDASDEEIHAVLKDSALDDFVGELSEGIDTIVGESGIKLSGGQRQRLAIARALLRKSSIILFDESTSSLDNLAQNKVKQSIDNIKGKSTIVIVAHRLSTIRNVDKIFFLDEGKIIDIGTFDELFDRNEKFKTMFLAENI